MIDEANREALAIEIGTSIPAARVVRVLEQLVAIYGRPRPSFRRRFPRTSASAGVVLVVLWGQWLAMRDL